MVVRVTFFAWLSLQTDRLDEIGAFARYAVGDRAFPRPAWRLSTFLSRYEGMPTQRGAVKLAHREWRKIRKVVA